MDTAPSPTWRTCVCHRAAVAAGGRCPGGRAALGRAGTQHALPELPQVGRYTPALGERTAGYTESMRRCLPRTTGGAGMLEALKRAIAKPAEMKDEAYLRTLKARAFEWRATCCRWRPTLAGADRERAHAGERSRGCWRASMPRCAAWAKTQGCAAEPAWNVATTGRACCCGRPPRSRFPTRRAARHSSDRCCCAR